MGDPRARKVMEKVLAAADYPALKQAVEADLKTMDGGNSKVVVGARVVSRPPVQRVGLGMPIERPGK
jgi:hypothetical protein